MRNNGFCNLNPIPRRSVFINFTPSLVTSIPYNFATAVTLAERNIQFYQTTYY